MRGTAPGQQLEGLELAQVPGPPIDEIDEGEQQPGHDVVAKPGGSHGLELSGAQLDGTELGGRGVEGLGGREGGSGGERHGAVLSMWGCVPTIPGTCEDRVEAGRRHCEAIVRPTRDANLRTIFTTSPHL